MSKVIPTIMKSKEWKRLMAKKPKLRVTPFKRTKEEIENAKLMAKFLDYQWSLVEPTYRQYLIDCLTNDDPDAGKIRVFWDKDKAE